PPSGSERGACTTFAGQGAGMVTGASTGFGDQVKRSGRTVVSLSVSTLSQTAQRRVMVSPGTTGLVVRSHPVAALLSYPVPWSEEEPRGQVNSMPLFPVFGGEQARTRGAFVPMGAPAESTAMFLSA